MARLGRAFPRHIILVRSPLGKQASGTARTSGGGGVSQVAKKTGLSSVVTHGGGRLTSSGLKSAFSSSATHGGGFITTVGTSPKFGVAVTSGGGRVTTTAHKAASGAASPAHGGGSVTQTGHKVGIGQPRTSGGGAVVSGSMGNRMGSASTSGGGGTQATGRNSTPGDQADGSLRPTPDLNGFRAAMRHKRKIDVLGEHITFLWPATETWPGGTILDPDTGKPYDPVVLPTASARASATLPAGVAFRAINRAGIGGEAGAEAVGFLDQSHAMLILSSGYASAVEGAELFICRESQYEIRTTKFDGVTDIDRFLVYGAREKASPYS